MLLRFIFRGVCERALPSLASSKGNLLNQPSTGVLIPHDLHSLPRNVDQAEEIDFYFCSDLAV